MAGTVVASGNKSGDFKIGDRVAGEAIRGAGIVPTVSKDRIICV